VIRAHSASPPPVSGVPARLVSILVTAYAVGVVALYAARAVELPEVGLLLLGPVALAIAVLRPEWTILVLVALPPSIGLPPLQMIGLTLTALFGFLLQGRLHLGLRTGIYPFVAIIVLATVFRADVSAQATEAASATLKQFVYYALLMLVAFHAVVNRTMPIDAFVTAFLLGVASATILQPFLGVGNVGAFASITDQPFSGHFAYLAVMGFGLAYVRVSLSRSVGRAISLFDTSLMLVFLLLTAISFGRAAWMAALVVIALVSIWTRKKSFWVIGALFLVIALTVPVVGEQIVPGGSPDITATETLARVTTGRSELWNLLWRRGVDALPFGQGWGYIQSLDSTDIFGFESNFQRGESPFVYPHNDFLYLFVDLGIAGVGLLLAFWFVLLRGIRFLSRSTNRDVRYGIRILVPLVVVMLVLQLFENGLSIRFVGTRFFIAAGMLFGFVYLERQSATLNVARGRYMNEGNRGG
jgi:O-antigen ligase